MHWVNVTGSSKKNLAKFSDTCSVWADGLCIGSPSSVGGRKAVNSNMQEFFCTTLYCPLSLTTCASADLRYDSYEVNLNLNLDLRPLYFTPIYRGAEGTKAI